MAAKEQATKDELVIQITDGPPELDFLFALARRTQVHLTLSVDQGKVLQDRQVFIDALEATGWLTHPSSENTLPDSETSNNGNVWKIKGHFWGDGKKSWSRLTLLFNETRGAKEKEYYSVWGSFQGSYNKRTRKGQVTTTNYKKGVVKVH